MTIISSVPLVRDCIMGQSEYNTTAARQLLDSTVFALTFFFDKEAFTSCLASFLGFDLVGGTDKSFYTYAAYMVAS